MGTSLFVGDWLTYVPYGLTAFSLILALVAFWALALRRQVKRRTAELERETGFLRTLVDTLPDLVWLKDPEGVYLACNREFELFFGASEAAIRGRTDHDFVPKELADFFRGKDREAMNAGGPRVNEEEIAYASDGHKALLETIKTPMFDRSGRLIGVLGIGRDITARRLAEQQTLDSQERFAVAFRASPVAASLARLKDGYFVEVNDKYMRDFGWAREEIVGRTSAEIGLWPTPEARTAWADRLAKEGTIIDYETIWYDRSRRPRQVSISAEVVELQGERQILAYTVDVTERRRNEGMLRLSARVFDSTAEGITFTDPEGNIIAANKAFTAITGYSEDEVLGRNPRFLRSGRHDPEFYEAMWRAIAEKGLWQGELWNRRKNGTIFPEWLTISAVRDEAGATTHYVAVFSDITSVKESQEALRFIAHHDALTQLPNRILLRDRLEHALQRVQRIHGKVAVLFVDLDRFKQINDTLGHPVGDDVLRQAASTMARQLRHSDTIARVGGDEFVVILEQDVTTHSIAIVARKLVEAFVRPFRIAERELYVTASIGISVFPADGEDPDTLLKNADIAMYRAKALGRNNYQFFEAAMGAGALEQLTVENALRGAVGRGEFYLHFQPQISLKTNALAGVEALVRWRHPQLGPVSPAQFIPVAEEMGIIHELGGWVLREACRQMSIWRQSGFCVPRLAVNVSVRQLEKESLLQAVAEVLAETGLDPWQLELEVTESVLMRQADQAVKLLEGLRNLGVFVAVDDFGTGYSSLAYLKKMPVHRLKIDSSFVRDIGKDPNDEAIARAVIALAHSLGLDVVAEGVERQGQADFLSAEGCDCAQGYLYARPLPPDELLAAWGGAAVESVSGHSGSRA